MLSNFRFGYIFEIQMSSKKTYSGGEPAAKKSKTGYGTQKVWLDVDTGVDDAQAILMVLAQDNTQLLGISCVAGNSGVDQVCLNTLRVLRVAGRLDVSDTDSLI